MNNYLSVNECELIIKLKVLVKIFKMLSPFIEKKMKVETTT